MITAIFLWTIGAILTAEMRGRDDDTVGYVILDGLLCALFWPWMLGRWLRRFYR